MSKQYFLQNVYVACAFFTYAGTVLFWLPFSLLSQYKKDEMPLEGEKVTERNNTTI